MVGHPNLRNFKKLYTILNKAYNRKPKRRIIMIQTTNTPNSFADLNITFQSIPVGGSFAPLGIPGISNPPALHELIEKVKTFVPSFPKPLSEEVSSFCKCITRHYERDEGLTDALSNVENAFLRNTGAKLVPEEEKEEDEFRSLFLDPPPPGRSNAGRCKGKWIFLGDHRIGCNGVVDQEFAWEIFTRLNQTKCPGIEFKKKHLVEFLIEGTCTAMAVEFARAILAVKSIGRPDDIFKSLGTIGSFFETSSLQMRSKQAAFNTIEVDRQLKNIDFSKNKVQSLLNLYEIQIDHCSDEFDLSKTRHSKAFNRWVKSLPDGIFFLRVLESAENYKLEAKGHSLIYINLKGRRMLYDPLFGLVEFDKQASPDLFFNQLKELSADWNLDVARFYRIDFDEKSPYRDPELKKRFTQLTEAVAQSQQAPTESQGDVSIESE